MVAADVDTVIVATFMVAAVDDDRIVVAVVFFAPVIVNGVVVNVDFIAAVVAIAIIDIFYNLCSIATIAEVFNTAVSVAVASVLFIAVLMSFS